MGVLRNLFHTYLPRLLQLLDSDHGTSLAILLLNVRVMRGEEVRDSHSEAREAAEGQKL